MSIVDKMNQKRNEDLIKENEDGNDSDSDAENDEFSFNESRYSFLKNITCSFLNRRNYI